MSDRTVSLVLSAVESVMYVLLVLPVLGLLGALLAWAYLLVVMTQAVYGWVRDEAAYLYQFRPIRTPRLLSLPVATVFVPSPTLPVHECPAHGATPVLPDTCTDGIEWVPQVSYAPVPVADMYDPDLELSDADYAACLAPVATLLPTEARRVALPVRPAPVLLLSYTPAPVPAPLSGEALYAALASSRAGLSAGIARVRADYADEECVQVAACPASEEAPVSPLRSVANPACVLVEGTTGAFPTAEEAAARTDALLALARQAPSAPLAPAPLSYRDLQAACKARGLSAKGSAAVLRERLAR